MMNLMLKNENKKPILFNNILLLMLTVALLLLTLCTFFQNRYSVLIHLAIFVLCFCAMKKISKRIITLIVISIIPALILVLLSINNIATTPIMQFGFFLHYITWPILLITINEHFSEEQKLFILRVIVLLAIIGNIASLRILIEDNEVSRLLAGWATESQMAFYYAKGVGGYGYVFAMVFLTYGAIAWLKNTKKIFDKLFLSIFLITNYLFILYSSYTVAIIFVLLITIAACTSKMSFKNANLILIVFAIAILILGKLFLEFGINVARNLELEWVVKRLSQLHKAQQSGDFTELRRAQLYMQSISSFFANPITGGGRVGGHSHLLDWLGMFGFCAVPAFATMFFWCRESFKIAKNKNLIVFFVFFAVFATIDTCSAMQIPVTVLFAVPLILNVFTNEEGNEIKKIRGKWQRIGF
jgi:hypothetical protein